LNAAPKPDLLIRLDVPRDVLKARLRERERQQGVLERLFEFDLKRNLQSIQVLDRLHDILCAHGEPIACASSLDASSLSDSVKKIESLLVGVPNGERRGAVQ
jgi:hypothetical protein